MKLRDYQAGETGVAGIYEAMARYKRVLYVCPTGGGKSLVVTDITLKSILKNNIVHLLVHRDKLLQQLYDRIHPLLDGAEIGWVKSGRQLNSDANVQLVSIQSWNRRKLHLPEPKLIITDEAHRAVAPTYLAHQAYYPNAYSLGVTATPCTLSGTGLDVAYDVIVHGPQMQWLTDNGYLSPFKYLPFDPIIKDLGSSGTNGEFKLARISKKVNPKDYAHLAIRAYNEHIPGKKTLVFCIDIAHARALVDEYNQAGIPSGVYVSDATDDENDAVLDAFNAGKILCLMSVEIFNEGVDIPTLDAIQMLRPTDSLRIYLQQVGRVVRYVEGKVGWVLDHVGNFDRHGHPLKPRRWTLEGELGELERKREAKKKREETTETKKVWVDLGFSPVRAQKLLDLSESRYWANWLRRTIRTIEDKNYKPTMLIVKLKKHHLAPPWPVYEAAGAWLVRKGAVRPGWAAYEFRDKHGHLPMDQPKKKPKLKPEWDKLLQVQLSKT